MSDKPALGDKVKIIDNLFKHMERFVGREGTVTGSVTDYSCVVTLTKGAGHKWFDFRELEVTKKARKK